MVEPDAATITTQEGTCLPNMDKQECGQEADESVKDTSTKTWTAIIADKNQKIHCGGVLVCSSWVVTTASCLKQLTPGVPNSDIYLYLGMSDGKDLQLDTATDIKEIIYHPLYVSTSYTANKKLAHDIAAIRIAETTEQPICLPTIKMAEPVYSILFTTDKSYRTDIYTFGYGPKDGATEAGEIKINKFKVVERKTCEETYKSVDFAGSICTQGIETDDNVPTEPNPYVTPNSAVSKVCNRRF